MTAHACIHDMFEPNASSSSSTLAAKAGSGMAAAAKPAATTAPWACQTIKNDRPQERERERERRTQIVQDFWMLLNKLTRVNEDLWLEESFWVNDKNSLTDLA